MKIWGGRRYCFECKRASHRRVYARARARKSGVKHMLPTQPIRELIEREAPPDLPGTFAQRWGVDAEQFRARVTWLTLKYAPLEVIDEFCCALNLPTAYVYGEAYLRLPATEEDE